MDWESQDDGFMAKLLVPDGAKDIPVGAPVAVFVEDKVSPQCGHQICGPMPANLPCNTAVLVA